MVSPKVPPTKVKYLSYSACVPANRERILKVHVRKVPLAPDVELKTVARGTPSFSGSRGAFFAALRTHRGKPEKVTPRCAARHL
jgi:SpoVK/Ycf46/Vps4 family AAA+-type ATPase